MEVEGVLTIKIHTGLTSVSRPRVTRGYEKNTPHEEPRVASPSCGGCDSTRGTWYRQGFVNRTRLPRIRISRIRLGGALSLRGLRQHPRNLLQHFV